jgi:hypothetical protein
MQDVMVMVGICTDWPDVVFMGSNTMLSLLVAGLATTY